METQQKISLTDSLIGGLRKAASELEEFRLQAALGRAEAKDTYEDVKKKFSAFIHEAKITLDEGRKNAEGNAVQLKAILETLQVQLALGKAETKVAFRDQAKKISSALVVLESFLRKNKTADEYFSRLKMESEKFKIKLNIVKLQYELNKLKAQDDFEEKKKDFSKKLGEIKKRLVKKEKEAKSRWNHFYDEASETYTLLKKAFAK